MNLALFDLDNTLLDGDSDFAWAQFMIDKGVLDGSTYTARNNAFHAQYRAGQLDIDEFLDFQLAPLARLPREQLDTWHREFMETRVRPMIRPAARALVNKHLDRGDLCALVTATNSFVTGPISLEFGMSNMVATIPAQADDGRFTGKPRGTPAFREGKITRVEGWLEALGFWWGYFPRIWFYSDSLNDLPLLSHVSDPVAVDPDPTLLAHAEQAGWTVLRLNT